MYNFDLISDIHLDFYLKPNESDIKLNVKMDSFIRRILPENQQKVLIIAGDLGHYERQNKLFLEKMKQFYEHIILVSGNHDYYLVSNSIKKRYNKRSVNRIKEMKKISSEIKNVHYLDGEIIEIDGVKYGGTGMWYDFSYGQKELETNKEEIYTLWWNIMNDNQYIYPMNIEISLEMFENEKNKLNAIIEKSDVVVTHVSPIWNNLLRDLTTSFYSFDGSEFFNKISQKVWVYGHIHERSDFENYNCRFVNASFGYPEESKNRKIENIKGGQK